VRGAACGAERCAACEAGRFQPAAEAEAAGTLAAGPAGGGGDTVRGDAGGGGAAGGGGGRQWACRLCAKNHYQPLRGQKFCCLKVPNRQRTDAPTALPTAVAPAAASTVWPGLIGFDAELEGFGAAERAAEARACLRRTVAFAVRIRLMPAAPPAPAAAPAAAADAEGAGAEAEAEAEAEAARAAGAGVGEGLAAGTGAGEGKEAGVAGARAGSADEENDKGQMHKQEHKPAAHHSWV